MNALTKEILRKTAQKYPQEALKNDSDFAFLVREEHWNHIKSKNAIRLTHRALRLWRVFQPQDFSEDGWIQDFEPEIYERSLRLSQICVRILKRKIQREPELQLQQWETPPGTQLKLFED